MFEIIKDFGPFKVMMAMGLNPRLPDFMLPKKKAVASAEKTADDPPPAEEPVAGTSTGGQTVQVL